MTKWFTCIARYAATHERPDEVSAGATIQARIGSAFVDFRFTSSSTVADRACARIISGGNWKGRARGSVQTWRRDALIGFQLALRSGVERGAGAPVGVDEVVAGGTVLTGRRQTLVNLCLTLVAGKPELTLARVGRNL